MVEVVHPFHAQEKHQLTITPGEKLTVIDRDPTGWWIGRNASGHVGIFPSTYTKTASTAPPPESVAKDIAAVKLVSELGLIGAAARIYYAPAETDNIHLDVDDVYSLDDAELNAELKRMALQREELTQRTDELLQELIALGAAGESERSLLTQQHLTISHKRIEELSQSEKALRAEIEDLQQLLKKSGKGVPTASLKSPVSPSPQSSPVVQPIDPHCSMSLSASALVKAEGVAATDAAAQDFLKQLQDTLAEKNGVLDTIEHHLELLSTTSKQKEQEAARLQKECSSSLDAVAMRQIEALDAKCTELEETIARHSAACAKAVNHQLALSEEVHTLTSKISEGKGEYERLEDELAAEGKTKVSDRAIADLKAQISGAESEMSAVRDAIHALEEERTRAGKAEAQRVAEATVLYRSLETKRRTIYNQIQELKGNLRVYCRVRPCLGNEVNECLTVVDDMTLRVLDPDTQRESVFEYDLVMGERATQAQIFEEVRPLVSSILDGYNVCIFAYGQTGSGKTYTMEGPPEDRGVNYRTVAELFKIASERGSEYHFEMKTSILEVHNNVTYDLQNKRTQCKVRWGGESGVVVEPLTTASVHSVEEVVQLMEQAYAYRSVAGTDCNTHSSRSHCVLTIYINVKNTATHSFIKGKLHLIDLAGSERVKQSGVEGERLKEAMHINTSLTHLKTVLQNLATKSPHVAYRNTTLTSLLQDSLGGNCKCLMFAHICCSTPNIPESVCTLKYAAEARKVETGRATANVTKM